MRGKNKNQDTASEIFRFNHFYRPKDSYIRCMNLDYNIVSLIVILGFLQGMVLGAILLFANRKKRKSTLFLSLFILTFAYGFMPAVVKDLNLTQYFPDLLFLPRPSEWLLCPLFLLYVQKVSIFSDKKIAYWTLYPGLLFLVFQCIVFLLPFDTKSAIGRSPWYIYLFLAGLFYSMGILVYIIRFINGHIKEVGNQYSWDEHKKLRWARSFVIFGFAILLLHMVVFFIESSIYFRIFFSSVNVALLYWATIRGIMQYNVVSVLSSPTTSSKGAEEKKLSEPSGVYSLSDEGLEELMQQIDQYMGTSEAFTDRELTIIDIAKALEVHPRRVSTAINTISTQNFNTYVNRYRIEKAEKMLYEREIENLSVEGIGTEVGFHSKSAFYSAFKKVTGTTPSKYREKIAC